MIRPHSVTDNTSLPVLIWIFGGGLDTGSTADPQYNLSGIVQRSQDLGKPIIAVSMNYRLAMWGFLQSVQIQAEGSSNAGLLDQRMAMRWVQENIAAFGGDPDRVTIWGESAGAQSIGYHLHSYGGRNDHLYRAAILESGGPEGTSVQDLAYYASPFENLTRTTGCYSAKDQLACLRSLSSEQFFAAQTSQTWNPLIDGDFLTAYPSQLQANGSFIKIPMIDGANSDEGTSFGTSGLDNETAIFNNLLSYRSYAITPPTARMLLELYPDDPANEPPYDIKNDTIFPSKGLQYRREAAIAGDLVIIAQRRKMCQLETAAGQDVYSYRFDTPLWNASQSQGAQHFVNVVFSFQNISGALGPLPQYQSYKDLSLAIGEAYVNFVNDLTPNGANAAAGNTSATALPTWPKYDTSSPQNMLLKAGESTVEDDTFREDGIAFINQPQIWRELLS